MVSEKPMWIHEWCSWILLLKLWSKKRAPFWYFSVRNKTNSAGWGLFVRTPLLFDENSYTTVTSFTSQYIKTLPISLEIVRTESFWQVYKKDKNASNMVQYWSLMFLVSLFSSYFLPGLRDKTQLREVIFFQSTVETWLGFRGTLLIYSRKNLICQSNLKQQSKWKSIFYERCFLLWICLF